MSNIISFPERSPTGAWLIGLARCSVCKHEWSAVAPKGTDWLTCPECSLEKGRYMHPAIPKDGTATWECGCGCDVFRITRTSAFCINCATEQGF